MTFQQEYLCTFWDSVGEFTLKELARLYHQRTDEWDELICTGRNERGVAIPVTADQRRLVDQNAKRVYSELKQKAQALGFTTKEWHQAVISARDNR